jgi:4-hydroxy-3-polyprenylbenzoate decarboxylase
MEKQRIVIGVTGASGQIYAKRIIENLRTLGGIELDVIFTDTAKLVYNDETGESLPTPLVDNNSYFNRNASGSNPADVFIIIPCTMGTIGRISSGCSDDLISRIADVQLKERRKLIIVPRETPYSLIHLRNMTLLTEAGAIIAPASPSFYMHPGSLTEMVDNFIIRILDLADILEMPAEKKWPGNSSNFLTP